MVNSSDYLRLISDYGETLTITKVTTAGTYSPSTGSVTGSATTDYTVTGFLYNTSDFTTDSSKTLKTSQSLVVSASGLLFTPEEGDLVVGHGDILSVKRVSVRGSVIVYIMEVGG